MEVFLGTVTLYWNLIRKGTMDIEGQWTLELGTNVGLIQAGIIVFKSGRISGGDSNNYYTGYYQTDSTDQIDGVMEITSFKEKPITVFGIETKYTVNLSGHFHILPSGPNNEDQMIMDSFLNNNPDQMVRLICEKQSTAIL